MKTIAVIFLMMAFYCSLVQAKLIRVNNNGFDPDYTTLASAVSAASSGDTIYVEGSPIYYSGCSIAKKVTIIGPGYFISENPQTQAISIEAQFNSSITFNSGSDGSVLMGCKLEGYQLYINASNITVTRNCLYGIQFTNTITNNMVMQNYFYGSIDGSLATMTNSIISNNIMSGAIIFGTSCGALLITNNVIQSNGIYSYNSVIQNNIICNGTILENTGNTISYNLFAFDGTNANGNQYNISMANVFVDFDGTLHYSTDSKWKLKAASPAIGAGSGGVDCGAFGGSLPYVLSGIPNLPHIYNADIPGSVSFGASMNITIKVKSGN